MWYKYIYMLEIGIGIVPYAYIKYKITVVYSKFSMKVHESALRTIVLAPSHPMYLSPENTPHCLQSLSCTYLFVCFLLQNVVELRCTAQ